MKIIANELLTDLIDNSNDCFYFQSTESAGTIGGSRWKKKQLKVTRQKPFKLRTEVSKMGIDHESFILMNKFTMFAYFVSSEFAAKRKGEGRRISQEGTRNNDRGRETKNTNCSRSSMDN